MCRCLGILRCERLQYDACGGTLRLRHFERVLRAIVADGSLHRLGVLKLLCIYRYHGLYLRFCGSSEQRVILLFVAFFLPFCHEALQEPQSGDVLQERDLAAYAAFVGELGAACLFGEYRLVEFYTQQRPCSGADERHGAFVVLSRNRRYGTCRVVRADCYHVYFAQSGLLGYVLAQLSAHGARHNDGAEEVARQLETVDKFPVPVACRGVEHLGC